MKKKTTKTFVVTGATSGIGNLLVKNLAKFGYKIFAGYRNEKHIAGLQDISENIVPFYIDLAKKETVVEAAIFICEKTEKIDTLINVAGCVCAGAMECLSLDKIREQFEINTFSQLEFAQGLFAKLGVHSGGKIINVSSMSSFGIFPFIAPYCASKRALDILFNSMQIECWGDIKVVSIKPGVISTPLWEKSIEQNLNSIGENNKYEKEFNYMIKNAKKNNEKGLNPQKVVDLIIKVDSSKNPKPSYTLGIDAKVAEIISHLPQSWINSLVKTKLEQRCKS